MSLLALLDIFRRHREKATGVWKLGQEPCRTLFFDSGDIVFAQSTHPLDKLTHLLVERGKLTQVQLDYAMGNLKPGLSVGKNLIEMGFITQRDLLDVARAQVERITWGALGTAGESPLFAEKPLEQSIVRLPMDTPLLFLNAILNFQDRERLLELLGPLNQVVVLQTRRLGEMGLPADLAKLPAHLDGTHTLRELSQQGLAEPLRLGAFVLFLREMGWARLHEMPPMDRHALDLALAPEPEPLSPPLPEAPVETVPSLFSTIEAAARPTTNLEHLSQALDDTDLPDTLPDSSPEPAPEPLPEPSNPFDFKVQTGQAKLPTPDLETSRLEEAPEPAVKINPSTFTPMEEPHLEAVPEFEEIEPRRSILLPLLVLLAIAAALGGAYWWKTHRNVEPQPLPTPAPSSQEIKAPPPVEPKPTSADIQAPVPENPKPPAQESRPEDSPETKTKDAPVSHNLESRLQALKRHDLGLALQQGKAHHNDMKSSHWVLRLEIACQGDTVWHALDLFEEAKPDLFLLPITLMDGRACFQVLYGDFPSRAAAEQRIRQLPAAFRAGGNRPKPYQVTDIPSKQ